MRLRRNLSGIFIFDKLEGEEKPTPTCLEDCTPETRLKWLEGLEKGAWAGKDAGNTWLADEIMRKQPKHCFCGHIHSGCHGIQEFNGMKFSNVSLVNEDYVVSYKPLYLNV